MSGRFASPGLRLKVWRRRGSAAYSCLLFSLVANSYTGYVFTLSKFEGITRLTRRSPVGSFVADYNPYPLSDPLVQYPEQGCP